MGGGGGKRAGRPEARIPPVQTSAPPTLLHFGVARGGLEWVAWARSGSTFRPGEGTFRAFSGGPETGGGGCIASPGGISVAKILFSIP